MEYRQDYRGQEETTRKMPPPPTPYPASRTVTVGVTLLEVLYAGLSLDSSNAQMLTKECLQFREPQMLRVVDFAVSGSQFPWRL